MGHVGNRRDRSYQLDVDVRERVSESATYATEGSAAMRISSKNTRVPERIAAGLRVNTQAVRPFADADTRQ